MPRDKVRDISPKMDLLTAEQELLIPAGTELMGQNIGGLSFFSDTFKRGYGDNVFGTDSNGSWWGGADFANAVASIDYAGNAVLNSVTIAGYLADGEAAGDVNANAVTIDGGKITANSITASQILANTITANEIFANTITANEIFAGTITANEIIGSTLSAIYADLGTITAGTVTGATVRTASSGARFEISGSKGASYNSGGTELTRLDGSGLGLFGTGGNVILFKNSSAGTTYGEEGYDSVLGMYLTSGGNADMVLNGDKELYLLADVDVNIDALGDAYINVGASKSVFIDDIRTKSIKLNYGQNEGNIENIDWLKGYNDLRLQSSGTNFIFFDATTDSSGSQDLSMYPHYGDFYATGTKYFRIPHPDHPSDGWIQYTSVESPEVALTIRGIASLKNGKVKINLPRHWELVTEEFLTTTSLTPLEDCNGLFTPKAFISNKSFTVKELAGGSSDAEFSWEMTATRKGYSGFNPEQTLEDDSDRELAHILDTENNKAKYKTDMDAKLARHDKIKRMTGEKYTLATGKILNRDKDNVVEDKLKDKISIIKNRRSAILKREK